MVPIHFPCCLFCLQNLRPFSHRRQLSAAIHDTNCQLAVCLQTSLSFSQLARVQMSSCFVFLHRYPVSMIPKSTCQKNSQLTRAPERQQWRSLGAGSRLCIIITCMKRYRMGLCLVRGMPLIGKVQVHFFVPTISDPKGSVQNSASASSLLYITPL